MAQILRRVRQVHRKQVPSIKLRTGHRKIATSAMHSVPADLRKALTATPRAKAAWADITPLARNEWICWVISGKKEETRGIRIKKTLSKLKGGMRRPCCWTGCPHRSK